MFSYLYLAYKYMFIKLLFLRFTCAIVFLYLTLLCVLFLADLPAHRYTSVAFPGDKSIG